MEQLKDAGDSVWVVIPAHDEANVVGDQVRALYAHMALTALPLGGVIVVDNDSTDGTAETARAAGAHVGFEPRRGYGAACLAGVKAAPAGAIVLLMDADGSDDLDGAARVAALVLRGEADLAMGSRVRGTLEPGALTLQQRMGNAVVAAGMHLLYGMHVTDVGPTRAIRRERLLALHMSEMTYGWSAEMLMKSARARYRFVEMPVDYHARAGGQSKVSGTVSGSIRAGWSMLVTLLKYVYWLPAEEVAYNRAPGSGERAAAHPVEREGAV
jgi:glycosyltransferase involved in cell wall biosynthesis